jgi:hypothetical protein
VVPSLSGHIPAHLVSLGVGLAIQFVELGGALLLAGWRVYQALLALGDALAT